MAYPKLSFLLSATLAFTLAGCGSDDSDSGDDGETSADGSGGSTDGSGGTSSDAGGTTSDTGGTTGAPDTSTDAGGTASDSGGTSGTPTSGTTGGSACNPVDMGSGGNGGSDECAAYSECVQRECDDEYSECWGPGYASGDLSGGSCSAVFECAEDCQSGDTCDFNCLIGCFGSASDDCTTCLETAEECGSEACPDEYEECNGSQTTSTTGDTSTTGGLEGTCMDLEACCDSMEAGDNKDACVDSLESLEGTANADQYCSIVLFGYTSSGLCAAAP